MLFSLIASFAGCSSNEADPLPTDKLVIYCPPGAGFVFLDYAKYEFENKYPDVQLEYRSFTENADGILVPAEGGGTQIDPELTQSYVELLTTELNAGKGPDVILFFDNTFPDYYKVAEAGSFYNIDILMNQDDKFDKSNYVTSVFDGGYYKGKRLFIPLWYLPAYIIAYSSALESVGISLSAQPTFQEWSEQIINYIENHSYDENNQIFEENFPTFTQFVDYSGLQIINYETSEIYVDSPEFEQFMKFWKSIYPYSLDKKGYMHSNPDQPETFQRLQKGEILFDLEFNDEYVTDVYKQPSKDYPDLLFPFPRLDGANLTAVSWAYVAINNASPNKVNAYNFIKILLSYGIQSKAYSPVEINSLRLNTNDEYVQAIRGESRLYNKNLHLEYRKKYGYGLMELVYEKMMPYFEGKSEYEVCVQELTEILEFYLYE